MVRTVKQAHWDSIPPVAVLKKNCNFIKLTFLKAVDPFYLVSMSGEVKCPTLRVNVYPVVDSLTLDKENKPISKIIN